MKENVLRETQFVEDQISNFAREASRLKGVVTDAVEDSLITAKRAVRRGYVSAEDLVDEASHRIKRHPFGSVAGAFVIGAVAGWLLLGNRRA